ncbi:VOC family protein [Devosia sp. LjRoot16]|uniref:VOC family protein n=1 Tax=Devosia sp. LjRoot16 TaxID=3342271 RepID=UPI003ECE0212
MSAIEREIGGVFVPVSDIERARDWYRGLFGLEPGGEIFFGHIHVLPMVEGSGLVLDSKGFAGPHDKKPAFHFNTSDVHAARQQSVAAGAMEVGPVTDGVFFTFKDPDGNLLMVADVPPAPRS